MSIFRGFMMDRAAPTQLETEYSVGIKSAVTSCTPDEFNLVRGYATKDNIIHREMKTCGITLCVVDD
jgi:hypothetical protein